MSAVGWLILIGGGAFLLWTFSQGEEKPANSPSEGKEKIYLRYNKDEIMKNLIATEEHFRNVEDSLGVDSKGFLNCAVKHLASAESHGDEAVSHSAVVEGAGASRKFEELRNDVRRLRYKVQAGINPQEGILQVREIRRKFESFNPEYDISKCEACQVRVETRAS